MAISKAVQRSQFPHNKIRNWLEQRKTICIIGYGLSFEANAPHYYDIQRGIWSSLTNSSTINPFRSAKDYQIVMDWFNWRRGGINTRKPSNSFAALQELQQKFGMSVVSQSVDGLVRIHGIEDVCELYGNVQYVKCQHGHTLPDLRLGAHINEEARCPECNGYIYPDVQMFDWNSKLTVCNAVIEKIKDSKLLIKIGVDDDMAPFDRMFQSKLANLPILKIMESGLMLHNGDSSYAISAAEIELEIKRITNGNYVKFESKSYESTIRNFIQIYGLDGKA